MRINAQSYINFGRRIKSSEEAEYSGVLKEAKIKAGNSGKSILIISTASLPNETGVGNITTEKGREFINFAKKYWGINEIQLLPSGQYHEHSKVFPIYSGTSTELGNHIIDIKNYVSQDDYQKIVKNNNVKDKVNFFNVVSVDSSQEKILRKLHKEGKFKNELEKFKLENKNRLEKKALYRALREINGTYKYKNWNKIDRNLFDYELVSETEREKRIAEIYKQKAEEIDFYYFKQFLAEDSFKRGKAELNKKGIKLDGDMLCGFSYDEVWANPKAFHKDTTVGWNLPALNFDSPEGEKLLRDKVRFYAERFDGIRIDASWTYANQPLIKDGETKRNFYADKILNIIDDEVKKVKGDNFDLNNIMHEFATGAENFDIHDGYSLKPYVANRVNICTSDYLSENWGSNKSYLKRGWNPDKFILGATNHDSKAMEFEEVQAKALSKILKIPYEQLKNKKDFIKAKFAEPMSAKNNMIYFIDALNLKRPNTHASYTTIIPQNFEEHYFKSLENGEGFNPMDALEKSFKAQGLDKKEKKLYKKIVKYRKILEGNENKNFRIFKWAGVIAACGIGLVGIVKIIRNQNLFKQEKVG